MYSLPSVFPSLFCNFYNSIRIFISQFKFIQSNFLKGIAMKQFIGLALFALLLFSCSGPKPKSGIDKTNFDASVRPQDDFYRSVNGTWLKNTPIPADKSNYGAFTALYDESQKALRQIIEEAAHKEGKRTAEEQKVGDFYLSFMDSAAIEKAGLQPLQQELDKIEAIKNKTELLKLMAELKEIGVSRPFGIGVGQDGKQSDHYIVYIGQSGLGLPDRDYYLKPGEKFDSIREAYISYLQKMLELGGQKDNKTKAQRIFNLEKKIAQVQWSRVQNRNRDKTYNKFSVDELAKLTPNFDMKLFLNTAGYEKAENVIVSQPDYLKAFNTLYKKTSLKDWKTYLTAKTISAFASYLSHDFVNAQFDFYAKTLRGIQQNRPRWKRGVSTVEGALGEVIGKIYVQKYFKPEAKKRMKELVNNLLVAYKQRLQQLPWMSEETKKQALAKLAKFNTKIGYPDKWRDYSGLEVHKDALLQNIIASNRFDDAYNRNKLGKPVDRNEWGMFPQTVNAYYNPVMNEVVFPAAILQPPFFNMEADDAVNYGGIGAVIGHEVTHGFDDQGSKSDGNGNLKDWWTKEDRAKFDTLANRLVERYSSYVPIDSMHLNGKMTIGENIADLGGVTIAYQAYLNSLHGKEAPVIDGFTGPQRFFMGWAQVWRRNFRDAAMRQRIMTDPHSPSEFRANGVMSNFTPFYEAFHVKKGDKMYLPEDQRIVIW